MAGESVLGEYTLLNIFPRDIADAHLSGALHVDSLGTWILKPNEVNHDLRFFLQNGLKLENTIQTDMEPPCNLESALSIALNVLLHGNKETIKTQTYDYFNIFMAPFARGLEASRIKENMRLFILSLNHHAEVTLELELINAKKHG